MDPGRMSVSLASDTLAFGGTAGCPQRRSPEKRKHLNSEALFLLHNIARTINVHLESFRNYGWYWRQLKQTFRYIAGILQRTQTFLSLI